MVRIKFNGQRVATVRIRPLADDPAVEGQVGRREQRSEKVDVGVSSLLAVPFEVSSTGRLYCTRVNNL
jgi:hypothetical protein